MGIRESVRTRRGAWTAGLLAVTVTASLMTGCTSGGGAADESRSPSQSPSDSGTGVPNSGPVLAVKIDNAPDARPQTGLDAADVVYVEQVEGGLSRLMAVFASTLPDSVGPVRSARESDLELLRQFHEPTLAFSGAQHKLLPLIDDAPLDPEPAGKAPDAWYRGTGKAAPHNLYLRPRRLMDSAPGDAALTTGFRFGAAPEGGTPEASRTVRFPSARFTFTWSADRERWLVAMDGTPTVTTDGTSVAPATVVIQYVKVRASKYHDFLGNNTPFTESVGSGTARVLRDGRAFDAKWTRPEAADGTRFTSPDGTPMNFAPGQVWVVLAKA
ncbi:DUF3048 domain-containing protein [Streptomyces sp. NPDC002599]|uniref:DUF3048 domain-containing protein n=1 Tax=Streptomyces sp. NPDC002599 TaxID=3154421 RepID=UPI00331EE0DB